MFIDYIVTGFMIAYILVIGYVATLLMVCSLLEIYFNRLYNRAESLMKQKQYDKATVVNERLSRLAIVLQYAERFLYMDFRK